MAATSMAKNLAARIPGATLELLPETRRRPMIASPEASAKLLRAHLDRAKNGGTPHG